MGSSVVGALRLFILVWQLCYGLSFANLADGWGGPSHLKTASDHQDVRPLEAKNQDTATVMLTAGGTLQRGHPLDKPMMMRRQADEAEDSASSFVEVDEEAPPHKVHNTKELFRAMDLNGDGMLTKTEITDVSNEVSTSKTEGNEHHIKPTAIGIQEFIATVDKDGDGAIDLNEFRKAFTDGQGAQGAHTKKHVHRHRRHAKHKADSTLAAHMEDSTREGFEIHTSQDANLLQVHSSPSVSCGGHDAATCAACVGAPCNPATLENCCNGECQKCNNTCILNSTICVPPTPAPPVTQADQGVQWTAHDQEIANEAAKAAIKEENIEASENARREEEEAEKKKFSWSKFWLIVIITFSVILGICAIVSVVALVVFCCMGVADPVAKELIDDDGEGEEDDGGEEDEAGES